MAAPAATLTSRSVSKKVIWIILGLASLFVFVTSEIFLVIDYPLYHAYRAQLISDHVLLIPHALFACTALLLGPFLFSSRIRRNHAKVHRIMGRVYIGSVFIAMPLAFILSWRHPGIFPATVTQGGAWLLCAGVAFIAALRRRFAVHRRWMVRGYAMGFTFVTLRILDPWPAFWNTSPQTFLIFIIIVTFASFVVADLGLEWRELTS